MSPSKRKPVSRKPAKRKATKASRSRSAEHVVLLVGTRKGAFMYNGDPMRRKWTVDGPHFLGHIINHLVLDPRDNRTLIAASKTGHLGPTIIRSLDMGKSWEDAKKP